MVFTDVNFPGDHAEGGQHFQGCSGTVPSSGTSNDAGDCGVGERYGGASVTVDGSFESG